MASGIIYSVEEARALLPTVRATLLQLAMLRRADGDEATLQALLDHLGSLGVVVRDLDAGLVDIPTVFDGERAWLCWRLDDPDLGWWHTTREGYASRRRL
ncbi:MAG: DUF2203 domain-containing protein [Chloroflexi bacterium]|nr:DUF2203 domain-containing protein [Chloroflexota bacterium]